jgi:hypothetical protein
VVGRMNLPEPLHCVDELSHVSGDCTVNF